LHISGPEKTLPDRTSSAAAGANWVLGFAGAFLDRTLKRQPAPAPFLIICFNSISLQLPFTWTMTLSALLPNGGVL
jgi:hypothetical protein